MPKCGVCGWTFSDRTLRRHAETPCGEDSEKAKVPEKSINDLVREREESE